MIATGPSIRSVCRIVNQKSCGSGAIVGWHQGGSLIMTNAHVAGTKINRVVQVDIEHLGVRKEATVIRAAYSNQIIADWALCFVEDWQEIEPVQLSKKPPLPNESFYTKGFPRCSPHDGTDITQHRMLNDVVLLWKPDAIGGQSGSSVWSDDTNFSKAILTWSYTIDGGKYGAGQITSSIYKQNRAARLVGTPKPPGLEPLDFDMAEVDTTGADDPIVQEGFYSVDVTAAGIQDYPIWAEDAPVTPPVDPGEKRFTSDDWVEFCRAQMEMYEAQIAKFEGRPGGGGLFP